jgi:endonuclease/exonuclease/phosphatase family metal-dependent hydrolase
MSVRRDIGRRVRSVCALIAAVVSCAVLGAAEEVRVATFNVMNYLCMNRRVDGRFAPGHPKPEAEKAAVRGVLREVSADVVCLQEVGPQPFLDELRQDLAAEGLTYEHSALLEAADPLRHVAVLSRLPFREVVRHADVSFAYLERTEKVKRGVLEVRFDGPSGVWSVFIVHLKSPLTEDAADPDSEKRRTGEARAVRDLVLKQAPDAGALFLIVGDLNAAPDSRALSALGEKGERRVTLAIAAADSRGERWTHRQLSSDSYDRFDYVLASPAMAPRIRDGRGLIHDGADALRGSDHRLVWVDLALGASEPVGASPR